MKTIKFILNAVEGHSLKRIDNFKSLGLDVQSYGFDRGLSKQRDDLDVEIIGYFPNSMPYKQRIRILISSLKKLFQETPNNDSEVWYYFGLQMALFCRLFNKNKKYIYEESDMTHLGIRNPIVRRLLEWADKRIIKHSLLTLFTSEGFLMYHYGSKIKYPKNVIVTPNKLNDNVLNFPLIPKSIVPIPKLRFGFVGFIRYLSVYNMADFIAKNFQNHEFHFYGELMNSVEEKKFNELKKYDNVFFHGFFKNPDKLAEVYSNIDVVVSTYDVSSVNVLYAEPNKLYESIYYRTPIIVSKGTFLAKQVEKYHSGWAVDANDEKEVKTLVNKIEKELSNMQDSMEFIPASEAIVNLEELKLKLSELNIL